MSQQLGITFNAGNIDVRLQMVRVWGALATGTSALQLLSVAIFDPIQTTQATTQRILEQITDFPDQVTRACIGYKYPKAQREASLRSLIPLELLCWQLMVLVQIQLHILICNGDQQLICLLFRIGLGKL
jgi:hypothetical protein